jgi:hypothetical protein
LHCSLLVFLLRFFQALYLTAIMGRRDKKKTKNKENQKKDPQEVRNDENDPQEVQNDEATEKYKFQDKTWEKMWHETLQKLLPGQIIDIPYLKTLEKTNWSQLPLSKRRH